MRALRETAYRWCHMTASAWERTLEELLRGLNHSLSNRLSLVMTAGQYLQLGEGDPQEMGDMLLQESEKIEQLLQLLRLLPRAPHGESGPFSIASCLEESRALLAHHAKFRSSLPRVVGADGQPPVLGDEVLVTRFLLAACLSTSDTRERDVEVTVRKSEDSLVVHIAGGHSDDAGRRTAALQCLEDLAQDYGLEFRPINMHDTSTLSLGELLLPLMRQAHGRGRVEAPSAVPVS